MGVPEDDGTVHTISTLNTKGDGLGLVGGFNANRMASINIITTACSLISSLLLLPLIAIPRANIPLMLLCVPETFADF